MDTAQLQFLASLTTSIAYVGVKSFLFFRKSFKSRLFGILVSNTEGLHHVLNELDVDKSIVQPLVVDDVLKNYLDEKKYSELERHKRSDEAFHQILLHKYFSEYMKELKKNNPRVVFVVITSSHKLLCDLKVPARHISLLLPSSKYHVKIMNEKEDPELKEMDQLNREKYISLAYPKFYFPNKSGLVSIFERMFVKQQPIANVA
jgi:hypothetical protein